MKLCRFPALILGLALTSPALRGAEVPEAERQTRAVPIAPGQSPDVAIDHATRSVHLIYREGAELLYRRGDLHGGFGAPELVFRSVSDRPRLWDPRIVLDATGVPHVVWADGHLQNRHTWYANRAGGTWRAPLVVFDKQEQRLDRATLPHLVIEPDGSAAYAGAFTVGGPAKGEGDAWGILARIEDLATSPRVVARERVLPWNPQLALLDGELWVGGRNIRVPNRLFALQRYDKRTLQPIGKPLPLSGGRHGETARMTADADGNLHAAGTLNHAPDATTAGWYNTLERARAGLPPLHYLTTNRNAGGAGRPVRDRRASDRVYIVHWHGADHPHHQPRAGAPGNYLHFVRIESGAKVSEGIKISDRTAPHGESYRHTPAAAAHPDGGMVVVVEETGEPNTLFFVTVGVPE